MPTVQPPAPPTPSAGSTPAQATATVQQASESVRAALARMTTGQSLQATHQPPATPPTAQTVTIPAPAPYPHQIQVQTALGPITLQTALAIPKGAVLTLTLITGTPQPQFQITEINGKPVLNAQTALKGPEGQASPRGEAAPAQLAPGARLGATLVRPSIAAPTSTIAQPQTTASAQPGVAQPPHATVTTAQPSAPTAPATATAPPSAAPSTPVTTPAATPQPTASGAPATTTSSPTPVAAQPSAPAQAGTIASGPPSGASAATPTATPAPTAASAPSPALPTGTTMTVSIVRIDPPGAVQAPPLPTSGGLAQGSVLTGTVTGSTAQGQPIVQTPHTTLVLNTTAKVEIGAQVSLKVDNTPTPPNPATSTPLGRTGPADTLVQGRTWPDLDEAIKALAQVDPARFQQVTQTALPQPGGKLTAQMLFFLTALKGGDFKAWIGESAGRILERDRPTLTGKISGDFQIMSRMADEPQSGDWRLALIPLWNGEKIEKVHMYYRGGNGEENQDGTDDGTRFVLDVDLTNIGHVQIDGLVKSEHKKLDLIIRTDEPMPDQWRTDIGEIFIAAQELVGLTGGVAYQAAPGNFIEFAPIEPTEPHPSLFA